MVSDRTVKGYGFNESKVEPLKYLMAIGSGTAVTIAPKTAGVDVEIPVPVEENDDDVNVVNPSWPVSRVGFWRMI
jgi:hypothetical protein